MDCRVCRELLPDYASRALSADDLRRMRSHLDTCGACQARLAAEEALEALLTAAPLRQPPTGFTAAVLARVRPRALPSTVVPAWLSTMAAALSAAAVAVGLRRMLHLIPWDTWPSAWLRPEALPAAALPGWPWSAVHEASSGAVWLAAALVTLAALWSAWLALERA